MAPRLLEFGEDSIAEASRVVRKGGLIVFPTDTVYGLGCDPLNDSAVNRLFAAKRREARPIPILCDSYNTASRLVALSPQASALAKRYWPGALTIVAPLTSSFPFPIHQGTEALGVRVPGPALCLKLIEMCGEMVTGTSANVSGQGSCRTAEQAMLALGSHVDLILDGGHLAGAESTVVKTTGGRIEVLRQGAIRVTEKEGDN